MIEPISAGLIDLLKSQIPQLKTVEAYEGQLAVEVAKMPPTFPAAFINYAGSPSFERDGYDSTEEIATFTVFVGCQNLRKKGARPGESAIALTRLVLRTVRNQTLNLGISPLTPQRISQIYNAAGIMIYGIDFATTFNLD